MPSLLARGQNFLMNECEFKNSGEGLIFVILNEPSGCEGDDSESIARRVMCYLYEIPGRIWIIRDVGKLIVSLHLTGLVRIRSLIALPKIQPE